MNRYIYLSYIFELIGEGTRKSDKMQTHASLSVVTTWLVSK